MKRLTLALWVFLTALYARADIRLFEWQESREAKTGEKKIGFFLAPVAMEEAMEAEACGDSGPANALESKPPGEVWAYAILLKGDRTAYSKETLVLFEPSPCGSELTVETGLVEVDRKANTVRVALKVLQDGKLGDFIGNGTYLIKKSSKHLL